MKQQTRFVRHDRVQLPTGKKFHGAVGTVVHSWSTSRGEYCVVANVRDSKRSDTVIASDELLRVEK